MGNGQLIAWSVDILIYIYMVGGFNTILKNISQREGLSHILWKKCLKPPTRYVYIYTHTSHLENIFGTNFSQRNAASVVGMEGCLFQTTHAPWQTWHSVSVGHSVHQTLHLVSPLGDRAKQNCRSAKSVASMVNVPSFLVKPLRINFTNPPSSLSLIFFNSLIHLHTSSLFPHLRPHRTWIIFSYLLRSLASLDVKSLHGCGSRATCASSLQPVSFGQYPYGWLVKCQRLVANINVVRF
jgi:hypothetical protein